MRIFFAPFVLLALSLAAQAAPTCPDLSGVYNVSGPTCRWGILPPDDAGLLHELSMLETYAFYGNPVRVRQTGCAKIEVTSETSNQLRPIVLDLARAHFRHDAWKTTKKYTYQVSDHSWYAPHSHHWLHARYDGTFGRQADGDLALTLKATFRECHAWLPPCDKPMVSMEACRFARVSAD